MDWEERVGTHPFLSGWRFVEQPTRSPGRFPCTRHRLCNCGPGRDQFDFITFQLTCLQEHGCCALRLRGWHVSDRSTLRHSAFSILT